MLVPPAPGVLSAYGFHTVGHRNSFSRTLIRELRAGKDEDVTRAFAAMVDRAQAWLDAQGLTGGVLAYTCDLRFLRQGYEIEIAVPTGDGGEVLIDALAERFRSEHQRLYGFVPEAPIEMVNVRVEARGPAPRSDREPQRVVPGDGSAARTSTEQVYEQGRWVPAGVFRRDHLRAGDAVAGPAIITQTDTTTFVHGGHVAAVDAWANLLIAPEDSEVTAGAAAVDLATLEIIESALLNIREEMDAVVLQSAMSPIIREQHDEFPLVTDAAGNMLVGQFGSYVPLLLETFPDEIRTGDVILQSDPYLCGGAIQHTPDWLVLVPHRLRRRACGLRVHVRARAGLRRHRARQHGRHRHFHLGRGHPHPAGEALRRGSPQHRRVAHHPQQQPHAGDERGRPHGARGGLPHRGDPRPGPLQTLRHRHLPAAPATPCSGARGTPWPPSSPATSPPSR